MKRDNTKIITFIERTAKILKTTPPELLRRAGINSCQFYRWKNGQTSPLYNNIEKIKDATRQILNKED